MDNKQIIPTALGMSYEEIENLNDVRPYDFETEREKKWYEIGLIDGKEAADVKYAKFASYEDKTYITTEWLTKNGFERQKVQNGIDKEPKPEYIYCNDAIEISAELRDEERGIWRVWINFLDECCPTDLDICTVGELRMFLSIEGLNEIAQQFK